MEVKDLFEAFFEAGPIKSAMRAKAPTYTGPELLTSENDIVEFIHSKLNIAPEFITVHPDGTTDVEVGVDFGGLKFKKLPIKFGKVQSFVISDSGIESFENFPREVEQYLNASDNDLRSLKGCPKVGGRLMISGNPKLTSLEGICPQVGALSIRDNPGITSLHNIHKHIKRLKFTYDSSAQSSTEGMLCIGTEAETKISDSILGLFLIEGLREVRVGVGSLVKYGPWAIVNRHLKNQDRDEAMYDCQEELIAAGFKDFART